MSASFQKGIRILKNNNYSLLSVQVHDESSYLRSPVIKRGKGPYLYDHDENRFIDFDLSRGSLLLGHAPPRITSIMKGWLSRGFTSGFPTAAQLLLAKTIMSTLFDGMKYEHGKFLFYDSIYEAVSAFCELLHVMGLGERGIFITGKDLDDRSSSGVPLCFRGLRIGGMDSLADVDYIVFRYDKSMSREEAHNFFKDAKRRDLPLIADVTDFDSFVHLSSLHNWMESFKAVLFGSWISSGISFGCVFARGELFKDFSGLDHCYESIVPLTGLPPIFKIKSVQRSLGTIQKLGGISSLLKRYQRFFSMLSDRYFHSVNKIIYIKEIDRLMEDYANLRVWLLQSGLYFSPIPSYPLSISFMHSDDLLKRCADQINRQFDAFYSERN